MRQGPRSNFVARPSFDLVFIRFRRTWYNEDMPRLWATRIRYISPFLHSDLTVKWTVWMHQQFQISNTKNCINLTYHTPFINRDKDNHGKYVQTHKSIQTLADKFYEHIMQRFMHINLTVNFYFDLYFTSNDKGRRYHVKSKKYKIKLKILKFSNLTSNYCIEIRDWLNETRIEITLTLN